MKHAVKLSYAMLFFAYCISIFVVLYYGGSLLKYANWVIQCPQESLDTCLGISAVYRFSFVFAIFHLVVLLCCLTRDAFAKCVNEGCWFVKALIIFAGFIVTLYIPNEFFRYYAELTNYGGFAFLLVQSVSLIDFLYLWAEFWAEKYNRGNGCYGTLLILISLITHVGLVY